VFSASTKTNILLLVYCGVGKTVFNDMLKDTVDSR